MVNGGVNGHIIPRYYSVGSGEKPVQIKGLYMVELENLMCQLPYKTVSVGGTFRCALDCDAQCTHHGCKRPNDAAECYQCKAKQLIIRERERADKV